jgi:hypothetical protein
MGDEGRDMTRGKLRAVLIATAVACLALACTSTATGPGGEGDPSTVDERAQAAVLQTPAQASVVLPATDASAAAVATSHALFSKAPVVVTADGGDLAAQVRAASAAVALGAPLLFTGVTDPDTVNQELRRLGPTAVLAFGSAVPTTPGGTDVVAAPTDDGELAELMGANHPPAADPVDLATAVQAVADLDRASPQLLTVATGTPTQTGTPRTTEAAQLPVTQQPEALDDVLLLTTGAPEDLAAVATARAAGAAVQLVPTGDPRQDARTVEAIAATHARHVLALGNAFGDDVTLTNRLAVARTGVQLPGGGQVLFPGRRLVALYGHPGTPSLGVLGEQPVARAIQRAEDTAAQYQPLSDRPVVPTFEIIATVASSAAGADGDYSSEASVETLRPWADAAREAGVYVVLDLQPGTSSFLDQAMLYQDLLLEPNVGLALDAEWRLKPGQRHLAQIGSVTSAEVNEVSAWLATLTRQHTLPQKLLVLHQFRRSMITDRELLVTNHDEIAVLIHADGNGTPDEKLATWDSVRADAPTGTWWGWKNFYDEDRPTFTPQQTYNITPVPDLVSYQ